MDFLETTTQDTIPAVQDTYQHTKTLSGFHKHSLTLQVNTNFLGLNEPSRVPVITHD